MTGAVNRLLRAVYTTEYRAYRSVTDVRKVQRQYLGDLLAKNSDSFIGRKYHFADIHSYKEFTERVPLTCYEDYAPYIDKIANGAQHILTEEPVLLFEPTSGSSGARKLIPYTASLRAEFQAGIKPWLCDLYTNVKGLCDGKSYWSITPLTTGREYTPCGIPIGFEEDTAYFGRVEGRLMQEIMAVDGSVKFVSNMEQFWHSTAVQLLTCGKLSLISVWNPTFLTLLCSYIKAEGHALRHELPHEQERLCYAELNRFDKVFPELRLISLWGDGCAADELPAVAELFPGVQLQPKGLLSTECFTSFPLIGQEGSSLSIYSHFFEFRAGSGRIVTAERLQPGAVYEEIVTTGGGFYRYCTGDLVEVLSTDPIPRIRFLRRTGATSDLCGEKLTEGFVRSIVKKLGISVCLLAPEGHGYTLYTTSDIAPDVLDQALCEGFHYNYCRQLGQLRQAEVVRVSEDPARVCLRRMTAEGMRMGDVKPEVLSRLSGWGEWFSS
ncbi:MAG: GH3 auxin-responsive promoter family protein [Oscillospiraceae bacterium]|nr:GH3 auxin-responsive promoter family protein [Oscillospiraceae bacterium]